MDDVEKDQKKQDHPRSTGRGSQVEDKRTERPLGQAEEALDGGLVGI